MDLHFTWIFGRICFTLSSTSNIHHQFFVLYWDLRTWLFCLDLFHNGIFYLRLKNKVDYLVSYREYVVWKTILNVWILLRYLKIYLCYVFDIHTYEDVLLTSINNYRTYLNLTSKQHWPRREHRPIYHINEEDKPTLVRPINEYKSVKFSSLKSNTTMQKQNKRKKDPTRLSDEVIDWWYLLLGIVAINIFKSVTVYRIYFLLNRICFVKITRNP